MSHHLVEVPLAVGPDTDEADIVAARLWALGAVGIEERHDHLVGAFADRARAELAADALGVGPPVDVADDTGLDRWREHARPVTAGPFVVCPPGRSPAVSRGRHVLHIDPGPTFGSGSHPSTRLALALLAPLIRPGSRMLDVGCGSGVLSVAAAVLGAHVTASDIDPAALAVTRANATANGVGERVEVVAAGDETGRFDLTVVNVTIDVHEAIAPALHRRIDAGTVVVAGVLAPGQLHRAARAHGRRIGAVRTEDEWAALLLA